MVRLCLVGREQVHHLPTQRPQLVGQEAPVALRPMGLGAHERRRCARRGGEQRRQPGGELGRVHVVGVVAKRLHLPRRIRRRLRPAPAPTAEARLPGVGARRALAATRRAPRARSADGAASRERCARRRRSRRPPPASRRAPRAAARHVRRCRCASTRGYGRASRCTLARVRRLFARRLDDTKSSRAPATRRRQRRRPCALRRRSSTLAGSRIGRRSRAPAGVAVAVKLYQSSSPRGASRRACVGEPGSHGVAVVGPSFGSRSSSGAGYVIVAVSR